MPGKCTAVRVGVRGRAENGSLMVDLHRSR